MNSSNGEPSKEEWSRLYRVAIEFRNLAPWQWMTDERLFAVQDPVGGPTAYCCVLGALGQELGLVAYLGTQGFAIHQSIFDGGPCNIDERDFPYQQCCLMASFESRKHIEPLDYDVIRSLGLRFRGAHAWPQFRCFLPGHLAWYLNPAEVRQLTVVLEQAVDVCTRIKTDPHLLRAPKAKQVFTRMKPKGTSEDFRDGWTTPPAIQCPLPATLTLDEVALQRAKKKLEKTAAVLEVDWIFLPSAIDEGERPYFPRAVSIVDQDSGLVMAMELFIPEESFNGISSMLLQVFEKCGGMAHRLLIQRRPLAELLQPMAAKLGVTIECVDFLEATDEFHEGLLQEVYAEP